MRTRIEGLVNTKDGDGVKGVISRRAIFWRFLKVEAVGANKVTIMSEKDPAHPLIADGVVWIPRANIAYVQEIVRTSG